MVHSAEGCLRTTMARSRRSVLDLNDVPPSENPGHVGTSNAIPTGNFQPAQVQGATLSAPIDLDAIAADDDVIISSPRAFVEARRNSTRVRRPSTVGNVESAADRLSSNKRQRIPISGTHTIIHCDTYINLDGDSSSLRNNKKVAPPPPPPKESKFSCPICMSTFVEETSTKCGHIFCKKCIKKAISTQNKCPTCRKKTTAKDLIRIYLPATGTS